MSKKVWQSDRGAREVVWTAILATKKPLVTLFTPFIITYKKSSFFYCKPRISLSNNIGEQETIIAMFNIVRGEEWVGGIKSARKCFLGWPV